MQYYLIKSEPSSYSIDDLKRERTTEWSGIRNYQARNSMMQMRVGDKLLFYHSSADEIGIVGISEVTRTADVDLTQFDPESQYYDPRATAVKPLWYCVEVGFVEEFDRIVSLAELRDTPGLQDMKILQKGNRLSITPVTPDEYVIILGLAR